MNSAGKPISFGVRLTVYMHERLQQAAVEEQESMSTLVRWAVRDYLRYRERNKDPNFGYTGGVEDARERMVLP